MVAAVLVAGMLGSLAAAAWGLSTALSAARPASLGGALVASAGLLLSVLLATRLMVPGFF